MASLLEAFIDIKEKYDGRYPNIIYIAVGSANNIDHQYPPFLKKILFKINVRLSIILIDGDLEDIPLSKSILPDNTQLYSIKENLVLDDDELSLYNNKTYNCFEILREINKFCMETYTTLIYQSYTGIDMQKVAMLFDNDIKQHLNHIIYGIGERCNDDCFLDLNNKKYDFLIKYDGNIHLYNPYYYLMNEIKFEEALKIYGEETIEIIIEKNTNAKIIFKNYFIEHILCVLRTFYMILHDQECEIYEYIWKNIPKNDKNLRYLYESKQYDKLYRQIKELYYESHYVKILISFTKLKNNPIEFIDTITTNTDPYKWINDLLILIQ
jgi:hypothetical protein